MERATLEVKGMTCGHCVSAVKNALSNLPGICGVQVTLDPPRATIEYDPARVTTDAMTKVTEAEGYPSSLAAG